MNAEQREGFLAKLKTSQTEMKDALVVLKSRLEEADQETSLTDEGDISQNLELRSTTRAEIQHTQTRLVQINKAITNFDDDFGYCVECGADIPMGRLEFNPAVSTCVSCQSEIESKSKHRKR